MGRFIELRAADGFTLNAYRAEPEPEAARRGAVVVIQEIFGINPHIRSVCDQYAAHGYLSVAPALFDRAERGVELDYSRESVGRGGGMARKLNPLNTLQDIQSAIDSVADGGKVGLVGYCFGGTMAWLAGSQCKHVAAVAAYYGGHIVHMLDRAPQVPTILHFGDQDKMITEAHREQIHAAHPSVPIFVYPADHGFNCTAREAHDPAAAKVALERTLQLFGANLSPDAV